jgi:hypothetical protein
MTDMTERRDREVARTAGRTMPSPFAAKVVGVSFVPAYPDNLHELQAVADQARLDGEPLAAVLRRNPKNEYDPNAIEVHVPALGDRGFIGHLTRPIAARIAPEMDAGTIWQAEVESVLIDPDHMDRPGISINCKRGN